jgi:aerobic carbon-monoxide dehydrogenase small subunit
MDKHAVKLYVNGEARDAVVEPAHSLLSLLRDDFRLRGTKEGCATGECGACTVLVDGRPVNSCLYFAVDGDGKEIVTVEGLAAGEALHPVQEAFARAGGLQCGFCTPGMVVAAASLLADTPDPTESEVREGLAGNLCRCTGYQSIVRAVLEAARTMRESGVAGTRPGRRAIVRARA